MQISLSGADITSAVAAAFLSNVSVELVPGIASYGITTGIEVPANRRLLIDFGACLKGFPTNTAPIVKVAGDNVLICGDGKIDGAGANVNAISHRGTNGLTVRDIAVENVGQSGIDMRDGSHKVIERVKVREVGVNCISHYFDGLVDSRPCSDLTITHCALDKRSAVYDLTAQHAALLSFGGNAGGRTLTNAEVCFNTVIGKGFGAGNGIEFLSRNVTYPDHINLKFIGNTISHCSLGLTGGNGPNVIMNSNNIYSCHGMAMEISAFGATVVGNAIEANGQGGGILADGSFTGIFGTGININANVINGTIGAAMQTSGLISGFHFQNNMMRVNSGKGFFPQGTSPSNAFVSGNTFDGATTGTAAIDLPPGNHPFFIGSNKFMRWTVAHIQGQTGADTLFNNF